MLGALLGIVQVVEAADDPQLRAGALQRYLAEAVWFPTAKRRPRWSFEFGPNGEIVGWYTPGRQRAAAAVTKSALAYGCHSNPRCTGWWMRWNSPTTEAGTSSPSP
jgi:hypothetical protein